MKATSLGGFLVASGARDPYAGILAVPPACCVVITPPKVVVRRYWEFDGGKTIRYRSDADYEEHFREVFGKAVLRRLRADSPILAELSGGMDSSSIVSMADRLIASGASPGLLFPPCPTTAISSLIGMNDPILRRWNNSAGGPGCTSTPDHAPGVALLGGLTKWALLPGSMHPTHKASCVTGCSLISIASCCREWERRSAGRRTHAGAGTR